MLATQLVVYNVRESLGAYFLRSYHVAMSRTMGMYVCAFRLSLSSIHLKYEILKLVGKIPKLESNSQKLRNIRGIFSIWHNLPCIT